MQNYKKYLPLILLGIGILVVIGGVLFVKNNKRSEVTDPDDESALQEVPLEKRPVVSLIPSGDGHYLKLKVQKIMIDANSLDFDLLYQTKADITQGVPGTVDLTGKQMVETDLLLGTESSGKFRYDEVVEKGSIELKFRKDRKLVARFKVDFHLQTGVAEVVSLDDKFRYDTGIEPENYYVTMQTIGTPGDNFVSVVTKDGYAVYSSANFIKLETDSAEPTSLPVED